MGTLLILAFLAVVWAGVGVHWLRTRRPLESLTFGVSNGTGRALSALESGRGRPTASVVPLRPAPRSRPNPRPGYSLTAKPPHAPRPTAPRPAPESRPGVTSEEARVRRRQVLLVLSGAAFVTLVLAFVGGMSLLLVHLVFDAALLAYIVAIVQYQREVEEARTRVRPIRGPQQAHRLAATGTEPRAYRPAR